MRFLLLFRRSLFVLPAKADEAIDCEKRVVSSFGWLAVVEEVLVMATSGDLPATGRLHGYCQHAK